MNKFTENFHHFETPEDILLAYDDSIQQGLVELYPWQIKFLRAFAQNCTADDPIKQMLIANNGAGKSQFILAPCIVWMAVSFNICLCYVTSASAHQLDTQTERYIDLICNKMNERHRKEFKGQDVWEVIKRKKTFIPTQSYIDLIATDDKRKAEGKHPLFPGAEFGIFVDEGKSIEEDIYEALGRCHGFTRRLDSSSPGGCVGHFYENATANNGDHKLEALNEYGWKSLKVTAFDCPHVPRKQMEYDIKRKGLHDPFVRSSYFAEFTSTDTKVVIPLHIYDDCKKNFIKPINFGERRAGLDLSGGGDEVVLSIWEGNINIEQETLRTGNPDTTIIVNEVIKWIQKWQLKPSNILADDGGVGRGIISHLKDKGYEVKRMLNNWRARDNTYYANRGTENWFNFKRFIEEFQLKLVDDSTLRTQFTNRYYHTNGAKLLIQLESKEKARANGHPSPDRADAAVLAWAELYYPYEYITGEKETNDDKNKNQEGKIKQEDVAQWFRQNMFDKARRRGLQGSDDDRNNPEPLTQSRLLETLDRQEGLVGKIQWS